MNSKLRRGNKLSAYDMHTSRDDQDLRDKQLDMRAKAHISVARTAAKKVEVGDTVTQ